MLQWWWNAIAMVTACGRGDLELMVVEVVVELAGTWAKSVGVYSWVLYWLCLSPLSWWLLSSWQTFCGGCLALIELKLNAIFIIMSLPLGSTSVALQNLMKNYLGNGFHIQGGYASHIGGLSFFTNKTPSWILVPVMIVLSHQIEQSCSKLVEWNNKRNKKSNKELSVFQWYLENYKWLVMYDPDIATTFTVHDGNLEYYCGGGWGRCLIGNQYAVWLSYFCFDFMGVK